MAKGADAVAASNDELIGFVRDALGRGTPRAQIEEVLLRAGWSRDQVGSALDGYADIDFPVPVPRPKAYLSAREAFTYLLLFTTLYISAFNLGALVFDDINRAFPDALDRTSSEYTRQAVRWALASLIVACPVFFYLSWLVERSVRMDPAKRRSNVRRWLMYLTVFAAASVLIGDFITLVYNALGGELTTRFVLKVLTIGFIAGGIFTYYLADLRLEDTKAFPEHAGWRRLVTLAAVLSVVAAISAGLFAIGAPSEERARRLDATRIQDLSGISESAKVYFDRHQRLPASLEELSQEGGMGIAIRDPEGRPYEYRVTGANTYEVCAVFRRDSSERAGGRGSFWSHGPGRRCFQLNKEEPA